MDSGWTGRGWCRTVACREGGAAAWLVMNRNSGLVITTKHTFNLRHLVGAGRDRVQSQHLPGVSLQSLLYILTPPVRQMFTIVSQLDHIHHWVLLIKSPSGIRQGTIDTWLEAHYSLLVPSFISDWHAWPFCSLSWVKIRSVNEWISNICDAKSADWQKLRKMQNVWLWVKCFNWLAELLHFHNLLSWLLTHLSRFPLLYDESTGGEVIKYILLVMRCWFINSDVTH